MVNRQEVSQVAAEKHYDKLGVSIDLTVKINEKAQQLINRELFNELVNAQTTPNDPLTNPHRIIESEIVEVNAEHTKTIIITEHNDMLRARSLSMKHMDELEQQVVNRDSSGIR